MTTKESAAYDRLSRANAKHLNAGCMQKLSAKQINRLQHERNVALRQKDTLLSLCKDIDQFWGEGNAPIYPSTLLFEARTARDRVRRAITQCEKESTL